MRFLTCRLTWAGLGAGLLLASSTGVFAGCSGSGSGDLFGPSTTNGEDAGDDTPGDDTPPSGEEKDGGTGTPDPGTDEPDAQVSTPDADTWDDAGEEPVVDSGTDAGGPTTVLSPSPGHVPCGNKDCELPGKVCCTNNFNQCGTPPASEDDAKKCRAKVCDEAADCPNGQVCCMDGSNMPTSYCAANCKGQDVKLCQSNAECGNSTCETYKCSFALIPLGEINACSKAFLCSR